MCQLLLRMQSVTATNVVDFNLLYSDLLDRLLEPLLNVTSVALSGGNRAVFVEIGGAFSAFGVAFVLASLNYFTAIFVPSLRGAIARQLDERQFCGGAAATTTHDKAA